MQNQAFDLGVIASRHMVDADVCAQAVRCVCTHGQLMGGTLSGHLMHQPARSRQLVANGVAARTGAGEVHTLRMNHRAFRSVITGITDRRQGPDRIAPRRGAAISPPKPYLTEKVTLPKHRDLVLSCCGGGFW